MLGRGPAKKANSALEMPEHASTQLYFRIFHAWVKAGYRAGVSPELCDLRQFRDRRGEDQAESLFGQLVSGESLTTYVRISQ